ncbi:MAG: type I glutamate--ammonia ligase [Phycisphaerales bacterium]|nr:MAG: type I glutamate--ammonia ligase [Phycisphaerales bacterium]
MFHDAREALRYIAGHDIAMVDLKVVSIAGQWLHLTIPAAQFTEKHFEEGIGYDGSAGSGFASVESGDVVARPEPGTAFVDPFWREPTLSFICETVAADNRAPFAHDPRTIARRAVECLKQARVADAAMMAPEFEFHVFDRLSVRNGPYQTLVEIESHETAPDGTVARIGPRKGYLRLPPSDQLHNLRSEMAILLSAMHVPVTYHHHEVGAPGQCEIETELAPLVTAADRAMLIKYVVKNVARKHGKIATFMPKPIYSEAGNGMHVHQKLDQQGTPLFFDKTGRNYASLSDLALQYVGGLLSHGRAVTALTNPSTNSFKRLVAGFEAPVNLFFSLANRSAAIRVPKYAVSPHAKRIEYRPPDFSGNVYLSLAALLMAGLDGILQRTDVKEHAFGPYDVDVAAQPSEFRARVTPLPRTLYDATLALEADHAFLTRGEVFPESFIHNWIAARRREESAEIACRPHPYEYELYLDV